MPRGDGTILDPNVHEAFIRNYARQRGVNPDWVAALAAAIVRLIGNIRDVRSCDRWRRHGC